MHAVRSSVRYKPVSRAPRRLQVYRIGRVLFDLSPQPIDENVDRSLLGGAARARQRLARNDRTGIRAKQTKHLALALRNADRIVSGTQFSPLEREGKTSKANDRGLRGACWSGSGSPKHRTYPQQQFTRLKRLCKIVIDANFETANAILRVATSGQHENGHLRPPAQIGGEIESALARHHDVKHDNVEG
jgi:hypothetical protein